RILTGNLPLYALIDTEGDVDSHIAVGMRGQLPAGFVRRARLLVELGLRRHEDSEVLGSPDVGLRQPRRALGDRTVTHHLDGAHANPLVAQPGAHPGFHHGGKIVLVNVAVGAEKQFAGLVRVLTPAQNVGRSLRLGRRADPGAYQHLRNQGGRLAVVVARVAFGNEAEKWIDSSLTGMAGEFVSLRVAIEMATGRIRRVVVYLGQLQRRRVHPRG